MKSNKSLTDRLLLRIFGRPTGLLGRLGGRIMARTNRDTVRRAIALLEVQPNDRVIEIGFGPGVGIELLTQAAASGQIAGIDPSVEMLRQARARNAKAVAAGRVALRLGSAESLPFDDSSFDKALATNSMQLWPDTLAGLRELHRVLRPEGRVVLSFTRHSRQSPKGLFELLARSGFPDAVLHSDAERGRLFLVAARPGAS